MKRSSESSSRLTQAAKILEKAHKRKMDGISAFNSALIAFARVHEQASPGGKVVGRPVGNRQTEKNPA